jgi:hypothetical protein
VQSKEGPRRASDGDAMLRRRTGHADDESPSSSSRRRPRRSDGALGKGKGRDDSERRHEPVPLTEWPPSGMSSREELTLGKAMELISRGVPAHRGHKRPIPHAGDHYYALYATTAGNRGDDNDTVDLHNSMTQLMTLRMQGKGLASHPWESLEQPSYTFYFGRLPGTITLNQWAAFASATPPSIALRDPGVAPREVDLLGIFRRLVELEGGLEVDDEERMYKNLYRRFLRDPDKLLNPHKTPDKQITDLILVLSSPDWIDFSNPKNQVVTRFIFDTGHTNHQQYLKFFHQLLLAMELDLRISSRHHFESAKEKLLPQIPPRILWSIAVARRWRENVRIEEYGSTADQGESVHLHPPWRESFYSGSPAYASSFPSCCSLILSLPYYRYLVDIFTDCHLHFRLVVRLRFRIKRRQIKMLKRFAQMMKWPNLNQTLDKLKQRDADSTLDDISSDAFAFFSGLVLPGVSFQT